MADRTVLTRLKADVSDFNRGMVAASASAKAFTKELDTSTDRSTMLVQSLLAVGPALVPIGAAAVPAISGLTNQLAFAAAGAGVTALAFSGVGDALKATNEYAIEPTEANLDKMRQTLSELGPAGREFVGFLQEIRPELQDLQDAAQAGLLPGAEEGIRQLMTLLPQAERIVTEVSRALGDLLAEGGENLASPRWAEFFTFLETEARPTLLDMGRTLGNFAEGLANLWMAFDPLSDNFSAGFLQMSRDFAAWTAGLDKTEGFQEFLAYVERVGPKVWETLGALGNALLQIVEAAAPIGEATLPIIEALADVLSVIANSPAGPVLIGAAAGIAALSRAVSLYKVANGVALSKMLTDLGGKGAVLRAGAAGVGVMALSLTDLDERLGISNTANMALLGTAILPGIGTAAGAAAGLIMDLTAANDASVEAFNRATAAIMTNTASLAEQEAALQAARESSGGGFQGEIDSIVLSQLEEQMSKNARAAQDLKFEEAGLGNTLADSSALTRALTEETLDLIDSRNKAAEQALLARDAERAYEAAIDDASAAIEENGKVWNDTTEAGRANQAAVDAIAATFNNLDYAGQQAKGGIKAARDEFIKAAIAAGASAPEAERLANELLKIKSPPPIKINVNTDDAKAKVRDLQRFINGMNGKTVKVNVQGGTPGGTLIEADGGVVDYYARGGLRENHVAQFAPAGSMRVWAEPETGGEAYIPLALSKRDRSLDIWAQTGKRLGVRGFAAGGFSDAPSSGSFGPSSFVASLEGAQLEVLDGGLMRVVRGVVRMEAQDDELETRFATV